MAEERDYDLVIFGANGMAGKYILWELARNGGGGEGGAGLRWAIAGRSITRLMQVLRNACDITGVDLSHISVIRADVTKPDTLENMAAQTRILVNCVGPYRFYGEPVVKACVAMGTHYLDISGEPGFLDSTYLAYDAAARESGAYVVNSCGWDTIPTDLAVLHMQDTAPGDIAWVENYVSFKHGKRGAWLNFATFQSAIYCISNMFDDLRVHRRIMDNALPKPAYKMPWRFPIFYSSAVKDWCMLLPDSEQCIVERTQRYNHQHKRHKPVQFNTYFRPGGLFSLLYFMILGSVFGILSQFGCGRRLMEKYPRLLSGGIFKRGGPKDDQVASSSFSMTLVGRGWEKKLSEDEGQHDKAPNVTYKSTVAGPEFAYVTTAICVIQSASVILQEQNKLPEHGVHTPASMFGRSSLIERLSSRGVTFSPAQKA